MWGPNCLGFTPVSSFLPPTPNTHNIFNDICDQHESDPKPQINLILNINEYLSWMDVTDVIIHQVWQIPYNNLPRPNDQKYMHMSWTKKKAGPIFCLLLRWILYKYGKYFYPAVKYRWLMVMNLIDAYCFSLDWDEGVYVYFPLYVAKYGYQSIILWYLVHARQVREFMRQNRRVCSGWVRLRKGCDNIFFHNWRQMNGKENACMMNAAPWRWCFKLRISSACAVIWRPSFWRH